MSLFITAFAVTGKFVVHCSITGMIDVACAVPVVELRKTVAVHLDRSHVNGCHLSIVISFCVVERHIISLYIRILSLTFY